MKISKKETGIVIIFVLISTIFYSCFSVYFSRLNGDFGDCAVNLLYSIYNSICEGELTLWSPYTWCGIPTIGHTLYQNIYPINLLIYWILKHSTFELFLVIDYALHFCILCSGLYFFQRLNGLSISASFLSTLLVTFSFEMMRQSVWIYLFTGFVWLPLIVDFVILFEKNNSLKAWKYVFLGGCALGLSGLANQGQTLLINILVVCFLYLCYISTNHTKKYFFSLTGKMLSFGILGIALCAPALFPAIEFSNNSTRYVPDIGWLSGLEKMTMEAFVEYDVSFSSIGALIQFPTVNTDTNYYIISQVGVILSLMGIIGFFVKGKSNSRTMNIFAKGSFIFVICYSTGFVLPYIFYYIPFYNAIREPFLYMPYIIFPLALFVGKGIDFLMCEISSIKNIKQYIAYPACALILLIICIIGTLLPYKFNILNLVIVGLIGGIILGKFLIYEGRIYKKLLLWGLLLTAFILHMFLEFPKITNGISYKEVYAKIERQKNCIISQIACESDENVRYFGFGVNAWAPNSLFLNKMCEAQGYVNPLPRGGQLISMVSPDRRALLANIKYWYTSMDTDDIYFQLMQNWDSRYLGEIQVYPTYDSMEVDNFAVWEMNTLGTAWIVNDMIEIDSLDSISSQQAAEKLGDVSIDFKNQCYVAHPNKPLSLESGENNWNVHIDKYSNDRVIFSANTKKNAILITSELWYPGWVVYVDGKKQELLQVNCCFKGCEILAGTHTIEFKYEPFSLYIGLLFCILGILYWFIVWRIMCNIKNKKLA